MLLPDNMKPESSIYYLSSLLLIELKGVNRFEVLYEKVNKKHKISYNKFCLCMDWLFLARIIEVNENGELKKCT